MALVDPKNTSGQPTVMTPEQEINLENMKVDAWRATCIKDHSLGDSFELTKWNKADWDAKHSGVEFDLAELKAKFKTHCPDYGDEITDESMTFSTNFCSRIMYDIGPQSRKVKKSNGDKYWKIFCTHDNKERHTIHIATFKSENSNFVQEKKELYDRGVLLTVKQAGLIAMDPFLKIVRLGCKSNQIYLTPLAGACFSKQDIPMIAEELKKTLEEVIVTINASAQSGGHYLEESNIAVAVACAFAATKNIKEEAVRSAIVNKVTRQYCNMKKEFQQSDWDVYSKYCTGGVPSHLSFETLKVSYEKNQQFSNAKLRKAANEMENTKTTYDKPGLSTGLARTSSKEAFLPEDKEEIEKSKMLDYLRQVVKSVIPKNDLQKYVEKIIEVENFVKNTEVIAEKKMGEAFLSQVYKIKTADELRELSRKTWFTKEFKDELEKRSNRLSTGEV